MKILRSDLAEDRDFVRRFQVEAQAVASLSHPNIVSIYDVGQENGLPYLVMEYVKGLTLREIIQKEGRSVRRKPSNWVFRSAQPWLMLTKKALFTGT